MTIWTRVRRRGSRGKVQSGGVGERCVDGSHQPQVHNPFPLSAN